MTAPDRADLVTDHHATDPHWHDPDGVTLHYATPDRADHDWDAAFDTLTSTHVFPKDRLNAREQTVFQMTVGYIKRHMRDRLRALATHDATDDRGQSE